MAKLDRQVAIVTGASSGIGKAIAELFATNGAAVTIVHHDDADLAKQMVASIEASGGRAIAVAADVREQADVDRVFARSNEAFGAPTILVNDAGVDAAGIPVAKMEASHFEDVLRVNLIGPFRFCQAFLRHRIAGAAGRIINITSVHEDIPRAGAADYCASKGGLRNLTRCLALELAEQGVTVNNIAPGMVLTPMNQNAIDDPKVRKEQTDSIPMKRAANPGEVAELALYLASDAAAYATGASFTLDGGLKLNQGQGA